MTLDPRKGQTDPMLILACSGAADVGELADQAARRLRQMGFGKMFCLAAVAAGNAEAITKVKAAGKVVAIDGCDKHCTTAALQAAGITANVLAVQLDELGMKKGETPVTEPQIQKVIERAKAQFNKTE